MSFQSRVALGIFLVLCIGWITPGVGVGQVVMSVTGQRFQPPDTSIDTTSNADSSTSPTPTCDQQLVIQQDGTVAHEDMVASLSSPFQGEAHALLRDVTLVNQFSDKLQLTQIYGWGGFVTRDVATSTIYFDKRQSVCFNSDGLPVSGTGTFRLEPSAYGQPVAGWLLNTNLPRGHSLTREVSFRFLPRNRLARFIEMTWVQALSSDLIRWGAIVIILLCGLVSIRKIFAVKASSVEPL